ncbi:hypothetical protein TU94_01240 [Streptomyces cyaneogriseus subsp. noncyanogenus]|uniref:Uncharacterized protein n=1 Tax=Streptomyces cyaneogriseus subsp. noncyanogenus TaxID=477245 RepID=A0A0C5FVA0_9ACTN|nr:hypothetical protein [Streptomyces cyaneogriseus]AJP00370.1 hypothetical protein TU94_01240 [Streptomyces cyaneogriseus subsp. noncyanogenus]
MDVEAVADELYALRPEDFTAARNARAAQARKAGDRALAEAIGRMRRPSLSAWAGNLLVRERPEEVRRLLRLGEGLRQAHRELDGALLRELSRRQRDVIGALSRQALHLAAEAGHPLGADAQREVENTLHAVVADAGAAGEWASGRLDRPLSATSGFPAVAEGAAPRREPAASRPRPTAPDPSPGRPSPGRPSPGREKTEDRQERLRRLAGARREADAADRELRAREREAADARREEDTARERAERLELRVAELAGELHRLEDEHRQALAAARTARTRARTADRRVRDAARRAETAAARAERPTETA